MSTVWKLEKDLCRCCHAEGSFKHLSDPCYQLGQEEIYSDMLQDCLDIKVVPMTGVLSDVTYTICESCVVRLRDAANFKRQVQDCEERFKDMYSKNLIKGFDDVKDEPAFEESDELKQEFQSVDEDDDDAFLNFDDDEDSTEEQDMITIEVEPKAKGKGKAKPKAKAKKEPPAKKPKKEKVKTAIKEESEDIAVAAVSGEKKKESKSSKYKDFFEIITGDKVSYACRICGFVTEVRAKILVHVPSNHLRQISCHICGDIYSDPVKLEAHKLEPHPNLKYPCAICGLVFPSKRKLSSHRKRHDKTTCQFCSVKVLKVEMTKHLQENHIELMPTCGVCGLKGNTQSRIEKHQRMVHLKEKNAKCQICTFECFSQVQLKKHMISHRVEKFYECRYCKKKFPRQSTCRIHEMIHTGEKKKVCSLCSAAFVQKASLNYHMLKHHPDHV